jgi:ubiquitin carboxyl-terminal hydrolase 4/11/15
LKKHIEQFKSDMPFIIFIRRERDDNFYYGKTPFIDKKHFSRYSKKLKEFLKIEDFNCQLSEIQTDISDYEIIVQFNPDSKYINKEAFDLDHYDSIEFEYKIKKVEEEEEKKKENEEEDDGRMTLAKCLKKFCKEEQLQEGDEWYCSKCKKHVLATKKMDFFYLPKLLIICFKRFSKESSYRWEKNDDNIDFPIDNLDMKNIMIGPDKDHSVYDLFAVSQHYGSTGFGHYTAVCKNDGKWFSYDDSSCSETTPESCLTSAAYVLFYRRRTD